MNSIFSGSRRRFASLGRVLATIAIVAVAAIIAWQLWIYYEVAPRTRDGAVQADIVGVAPDVSGRVVEVLADNGEVVRKGEVLFRLDAARAGIAVRQAKADLAQARATTTQAERDAERARKLMATHAISEQAFGQAISAASQAKAVVKHAAAKLSLAQLNLERTTVTAPVNGTVTNLSLRPGDYISAGEAALALVDKDTLRVVGYFEETKIQQINIGDPARIHLMGSDVLLHGHVTSIAAAINDQERSTGGNLLPSINPNFSWIRLAQRIPVRIRLDGVPDDIPLVVGRTASIEIIPPNGQKQETGGRSGAG